MSARAWLLVSGVFTIASVASGQEPSPSVAATPAPAIGTDSLYVQAQRLVNEGRGAEGRAVVDSLFRVAAPGTPAQAEALFWRATLATTAAEAERDYRQITVEHPLSRRAEDALLRLAQLELQRGERALALTHLERLMREHGNGPARARGAYWSARVLFEMNDVGRACQSLSDARSALPPADVELRNQIEYAAQRCPVRAVAIVPPAVARDTARATVVMPPPSSVPSAAPAVQAPTAATSTGPSGTPAPTSTTTTASAPATQAPDTATAIAVKATPAATPGTPARVPATPAATTTEPQRFSVQVAAYQTKAEADRLVKKFRANGYDARTFGTVAPFRVRIGRFRTRAEAVDLAKILKAKSGAAFVVVAEPR